MAMLSTHNIKLHYLTSTLRSLYFSVPIWILFLQTRISVSELSFLVGFGSLIQLVMELPTGAFADLFGKRVTVILSYFLDALHYLLFAFASSFPQFLFLTIFSGLGEALRSGAKEALVYDSLKQDRVESTFAKINARQSGYFQTGLIFATIAGGFLYDLYYPLPFLLSGLAHLLAGILSFSFIEPKIDTVQFTLRNYLSQIRLGVKECFKSSEHRLISGYYIAVGSISWLVMTYYVDFLMIDLGFDNKERGLILGGLRLLNILLISKLLTRENLFNKSRTLHFFPLLLVFSLTPGLWLKGWWGLPFVMGAMLSSTARWILLAKYTNEVFDSRYRATAISTLSMAISWIYVVFTIGSGPIMENFGGSRTIFTLLGIISLLTVLPLALKINRQDQIAPASPA